MAGNQLTVGVLGPSGMGGSHIAVELLGRGHRVVGISRNPGKIGKHALYEPRSVDLEDASIDEIATTFKGLDVMVCAYGPHSSGLDAMKYSRCPCELRSWRGYSNNVSCEHSAVS